MSDSTSSSEAQSEQRLQEFAALFAQLVMQQANLAMMLMGKAAHPETGQVIKDLEAAQHFIDTLEMLEAKTQGNLAKEESALLKQSLMSLRLAFVQAVESPPAAAPPPAGAPPQPDSGSTTPPAEEEHRTKFSKKY